MPASTHFGTRLARACIRRAATTTTHQAIAFDAIGRLAAPRAEAWERLILRHGALFALGAAAPDSEFRDFKNHMVLPRDGYWGGAIARAQSWHLNLTTALAKAEWDNVAYCAGVLSHYVVDALHPFHTGQSEAENDIHYALDATVWSMYPTLAKEAAALPQRTAVALPHGPAFLAVALGSGASKANASYEK